MPALLPTTSTLLAQWPVSRRVNKTGSGDGDPTLIDEVAARCPNSRTPTCAPARPESVGGPARQVEPDAPWRHTLPTRKSRSRRRGTGSTRQTSERGRHLAPAGVGGAASGLPRALLAPGAAPN